MTRAEGDRFTVTLNLPTDNRDAAMKATFICGGTTVTNIIGKVVLIDPSGQITDKATGAPIVGARVVLYRRPNAFPDATGQTRDCRTVDTRGANSWDHLPPTTLNQSERLDSLAETISSSPQISPTINPQTTGSDGRYAWDVITGCWYVEVGATGYLSVTSALVGVPPAVTDLHIKLEKGTSFDQRVYLPIVRR